MKKIVDGVAVDMTAEEIAEFNAQQAEWAAGADDRKAEEVRRERNIKLAATDWRASSDYVMSDAWKIYRQSLRDIPQQAGFPTNVVWPVEPN
jgi:hypothetical protein